MQTRRAVAILGVLVAIVCRPAVAAACSFAWPVGAARVSGDDGDGLRPWFLVFQPPATDDAVKTVELRRVAKCRRRSCPGTVVAIERAGDYVRPAVELTPGKYQISIAFSRPGTPRELVPFTVRKAGPRADFAAGRTRADAWYDQGPLRPCAPKGSPDVVIVLEEWATRAAELRGRLLVVYDRKPDPEAPWVGVVKIVPIHHRLVTIREARPQERWSVGQSLPPLWVAVADDDGGLTPPTQVPAR